MGNWEDPYKHGLPRSPGKPREKVKKMSEKKFLPIPDGMARVNFLDQAAKLLNSSNLSNSLVAKLNCYYGTVNLMVRDKYLVKVEPTRKREKCAKCQSTFSAKRKNFQIEVINEKDDSKRYKLEIQCKFCGHRKPKTYFNKKPNQNRKTNFKEVTS